MFICSHQKMLKHIFFTSHPNCSDKSLLRLSCFSDSPTGSYPNTKLVLQELDIPHFTMDDCRHVQHVCWQVSQRAAYLAGTGTDIRQVFVMYQLFGGVLFKCFWVFFGIGAYFIYWFFFTDICLYNGFSSHAYYCLM